MAPAPKTRNRFIPCLRKTFSCGSFFPMLIMRNSGRQLRWLLALGKTAAGYGLRLGVLWAKSPTACAGEPEGRKPNANGGFSPRCAKHFPLHDFTCGCT